MVLGEFLSADVRLAGRRTEPSSRGEIKALTGLRAVAATWVVLFHVQALAWPYLDQLPLVRQVISAGWTGVELFFVLSGFVITLSYVERVGRRPSPRVVGRFVLNRFARVWPAWAAVTMVAGGWVWLMRRNGLDADLVVAHPDADLATLSQQLTMTHMWGRQDPVGAGYVLPGWSISAEWAAYLAFPLLAVALRWLRHLPAWLLLAAAVLTMSPLSVTAFTTGTPDSAQDWVLRIACGFTAGALTALAVRRARVTERLESLALGLVCSSLCMVVGGAVWAGWRRGSDYSQDFSGVVVVLFPLLVFGLALTDRGPARWLSGRSIVHGGRLSYSLYLVHFVVLDVVVTMWWQRPEHRGELTPGLALAVVPLVMVCFVLSAALHHGVEEPGRRLVLRLAGQGAVTVGRRPARLDPARREPAVAPAVAPVLTLARVPVPAPRRPPVVPAPRSPRSHAAPATRMRVAPGPRTQRLAARPHGRALASTGDTQHRAVARIVGAST